MTAKQTAVEWLIKELIESQYFPYGTPIILIEQAKEMEKQQIIVAVNNGWRQFDGKNYYEKTYKNTEK